MTADQSDEQKCFIVYRDQQTILMMMHDPQTWPPSGEVVTCDVWQSVIPIALASDPVLMADLMTIEVDESLNVRFDEDVCSLYSLLTILAAVGSPTRAAEVARGWIKLPPETRERWWYLAECDKGIHAQVLGGASAGVVTLDSVVPDWLSKLVDVCRVQRVLTEDDELHWTWTKTPLGASCVAWTDDDDESPYACLAIADCNVSFARADDPDLLLAKGAITMLIDAVGAIMSNVEIADEVGLHLTGHEAMEILETLQAWMQNLEAAASLGAAADLSTMQIWDLIADRRRGRAA